MIYLLMADGMEEIEALCPLDLLRRAGAQVQTVSISDTLRVTGSHGITVEADILAKDVDLQSNPPEMLILPGGMPGSANLDTSPYTDAFLNAAIANDATLAAICAAPFILGKRGLLKGKTVTCFPGFEKDLEGATLQTSGVSTDGKIITAAGMGWAKDFGLELVRVFSDTFTAAQLARGISPHFDD